MNLCLCHRSFCTAYQSQVLNIGFPHRLPFRGMLDIVATIGGRVSNHSFILFRVAVKKIAAAHLLFPALSRLCRPFTGDLGHGAGQYLSDRKRIQEVLV